MLHLMLHNDYNNLSFNDKSIRGVINLSGRRMKERKLFECVIRMMH